MEKYSTSISKLIRKKDLSDLFNINDSIERILEIFGFDASSIELETSDITLKISDDEKIIKITPTINRAYYDSNNLLTSKVMKMPKSIDLISFEGEIYESIFFLTEEDSIKFRKENNYNSNVDIYSTAVMHFAGYEWNYQKIKDILNIYELTKKNGYVEDELFKRELKKALERKDIYIVKEKNFYTIYYGNEPTCKLNRQKGSFSIEELDEIIFYLEHEVPDKGFFSLHVRDCIALFKDNLMNREYNPQSEFISATSLNLYLESIMRNSTEEVYLKLKVISNKPIKLIEDKLECKKIEEEIEKKYILLMK